MEYKKDGFHRIADDTDLIDKENNNKRNEAPGWGHRRSIQLEFYDAERRIYGPTRDQIVTVFSVVKCNRKRPRAGLEHQHNPLDTCRGKPPKWIVTRFIVDHP